MASAMPPLAVPSSLVSTIPVTSTASANSRACWRPFCPVVASIVSSTSCGAPSSRWPITRWILRSSSIRWSCVWRRPAVSTMTTSRPRDWAAATESYATAAGSAPDCDETKSAPERSAQVSSCSPAAARKVSAAPITQVSPASRRWCAILPIEVVLPVPLTPVISSTEGRWLTSMRRIAGRRHQLADDLGQARCAAPPACAGRRRRPRPRAARSP